MNVFLNLFANKNNFYFLFVVILVSRIYQKSNLVECIYEGLIGLFNLIDINIIDDATTLI